MLDDNAFAREPPVVFSVYSLHADFTTLCNDLQHHYKSINLKTRNSDTNTVNPLNIAPLPIVTLYPRDILHFLHLQWIFFISVARGIKIHKIHKSL